MKSIRNSFVCNTPIAHRGLHEKGVPENSRAAFTRAIEEGYAIETDVRRTKDGTLVVVHDDNLRRLTGEPGKVSQTSYHDLSAMRLAGPTRGFSRWRSVSSTSTAGRRSFWK